jgi:hypothetical protein
MTTIRPLSIEVLETEFDIAYDLAEFASRLDEIKNKFPPALKELATTCAQKMHILAESMAGDRASEIYAPDDGSEEQLGDHFIGKTEEEMHL